MNLHNNWRESFELGLIWNLGILNHWKSSLQPSQMWINVFVIMQCVESAPKQSITVPRTNASQAQWSVVIWTILNPLVFSRKKRSIFSKNLSTQLNLLVISIRLQVVIDNVDNPFAYCLLVNPSNAEATFVQSTRTQRFLKTIQTLSCWYSLDSSRWVLSQMSTHLPGFQSSLQVFWQLKGWPDSWVV